VCFNLLSLRFSFQLNLLSTLTTDNFSIKWSSNSLQNAIDIMILTSPLKCLSQSADSNASASRPPKQVHQSWWKFQGVLELPPAKFRMSHTWRPLKAYGQKCPKDSKRIQKVSVSVALDKWIPRCNAFLLVCRLWCQRTLNGPLQAPWLYDYLSQYDRQGCSLNRPLSLWWKCLKASLYSSRNARQSLTSHVLT
jgi:hypothetical protein